MRIPLVKEMYIYHYEYNTSDAARGVRLMNSFIEVGIALLPGLFDQAQVA